MSNSKFNLQVPVDYEVKTKAAIEAKRQGFSSLQDITNFLLTKLAYGQININIASEPIEYISEEEENRLDAIHDTILEDLKNGEAVVIKNGTDLISKLKTK